MSDTSAEQNPKQQEQQEETHKVFIGNLSFTSTEETLKDFFKDCGEVLESIIIKKGSRPKGYGFVAFRTLGEAEKAVKECDKKELDGREVSVQIANQREPRTSAEKKKKKRKSKKSRKPSEHDNESSNEDNTTVSTKKENKQEKSKPKTSVFVANLPLDITMMDLTELFKDYQVESALVAIQRSGRSKGYGFVELTTVDEMNRVLREFVDIEIQGRPIHISAATSEKTSVSKPKSVNKEDESTAAASTPTTPKKKSKNRRSKKNSAAKENNQNDEMTPKEEEGISAAKKAKEAVRVAKEDDGVHAAKDANEAVKVAKEEDGISAAKEAKEAVRVAKEDDGVHAAKEANEAVKEDTTVDAKK